jgi:acetyl-CoA acetyltransferase
MTSEYLIEGVRTSRGKYGGSLSAVRPNNLAAIAIHDVVRRSGIEDDAIDEVNLRMVNQAGEHNRGIARIGLLLADPPVPIPASTVNCLRASSFTAVAPVANQIKAGEADVVNAGGVKSTVRTPWVLAKSPAA